MEFMKKNLLSNIDLNHLLKYSKNNNPQMCFGGEITVRKDGTFSGSYNTD